MVEATRLAEEQNVAGELFDAWADPQRCRGI